MTESAHGEIPIWVVVLIPFAFFIVFPVFWCFVIWILSHVGGWNRLAGRYRSEREPTGKAWYGVQGQVGLVNYKSILNCTTNAEGMYLEPSLLFRFAHPRLFIPWSDFHEPRRRKILWMTFVSAKIGSPPIVTLSLEAKVFDEPEGCIPIDVPIGFPDHPSRP